MRSVVFPAGPNKARHGLGMRKYAMVSAGSRSRSQGSAEKASFCVATLAIGAEEGDWPASLLQEKVQANSSNNMKRTLYIRNVTKSEEKMIAQKLKPARPRASKSKIFENGQ